MGNKTKLDDRLKAHFFVCLLGETETKRTQRAPSWDVERTKDRMIKLMNHRRRVMMTSDCCKVTQRSHQEGNLHSEAPLEKSQIYPIVFLF